MHARAPYETHPELAWRGSHETTIILRGARSVGVQGIVNDDAPRTWATYALIATAPSVCVQSGWQSAEEHAMYDCCGMNARSSYLAEDRMMSGRASDAT